MIPSIFHTPRFFRLLAVFGALVLTVAGLTACGDDEPQGSGNATREAQSGESPAAGGTDGRSRGGGGRSPTGPTLSGNRAAAREGVAAVDDVYAGFDAAADAGVAKTDVPPRQTLAAAGGNESLTDVCDLMSEEAKRQTIVYAERSAGLAEVDWTCEKATGLLLRRASQTGGLKRSLRAEVVGLNVDGDRATATVRFGGKGPISSVLLVKEDGEWKLAASPAGGGGK